ncbi:hypothetical protein NFI96_021131 [Prochilodus magdalenae]|nr:hypothetical protein NFI96_021131 [Prochilodus magdalenae]
MSPGLAKSWYRVSQVLPCNLFSPFGFVLLLWGPPADTPIEEFTPTPAFPALQYLESVDEGGVAWQAGLRTGDFLIEDWTGSDSHQLELLGVSLSL